MDNQRKEILGFLERKGYKLISACVKPLRLTAMDGKDTILNILHEKIH